MTGPSGLATGRRFEHAENWRWGLPKPPDSVVIIRRIVA